MINNGQSTLLLYCYEDVKSHPSGGDTVPLIGKQPQNNLSRMATIKHLTVLRQINKNVLVMLK